MSVLSQKIQETSNFDVDTEIDLDELVGDKKAFHNYIYTSLDDAICELEKRWKMVSDVSLPEIPPLLENGFRAVMFRQVVTPNFEIRKFLSKIHKTPLQPLFWEYHEDKFTSNNEWKHALGKLHFFHKNNKYGRAIIEHQTIVNFNHANGKSISSVETIWKQNLIDFHHDFFRFKIQSLENFSFEASEWFEKNGGIAKVYYRAFLKLFIKHGILFENFLLNEKELSFTRDIFLPAFIHVYQETGMKPLIVPFEPFAEETENIWMCYPKEDRIFLDQRIHVNI